MAFLVVGKYVFLRIVYGPKENVMKHSRMSNGKIAGLTIAAVAVAVVIAMISMPSAETKTAESAPPPVTNTDTIYFPSQFINKAAPGPSDVIPSF